MSELSVHGENGDTVSAVYFQARLAHSFVLTHKACIVVVYTSFKYRLHCMCMGCIHVQ